MKHEETELITATISLTREQWESMIYHVMNDASLVEHGLCAQIGKDATNKIVSDALEIANKVNDATGVDVDLNQWDFIYVEKRQTK